jgi:deoxyribose-phosphate aldolase
MTGDGTESSNELRVAAARVLPLLDLTSLNDTDNDAGIYELCQRAVTPFGRVAAVCVWPRFAPLCRKSLNDTGVRVASVINFPHGQTDQDCAIAEARAAVAYGSDEVDLVFPYTAWLNGDVKLATDLVEACKSICGPSITLKVIIETGRLSSAKIIERASLDVIAAGADFIKTSTGKVSVNATFEAAAVMLGAIKSTGGSVGFKAAGGVRQTAQAAAYLAIADDILGDSWATPDTFRFGASGLLDDLLKHLNGGHTDRPTDDY